MKPSSSSVTFTRVRTSTYLKLQLKCPFMTHMAHKWTNMDIFGQGGFVTKSQFNSTTKNKIYHVGRFFLRFFIR